jgi:hypothetical protein
LIRYPIPPHVVQQLDMLSDLGEIDRADEKAGVRFVFCQGVTDLPGKLVEESS